MPLPVGVRLMQLGADQAAMFMGCGCQPAVVSGPLRVKRVNGSPFSHGDIPYDDHGTAAGGNGFHFARSSFSFQPHGGRGEDDPVFRVSPPSVTGLFIVSYIVVPSFPRAGFCATGQAAVCALPQVRPRTASASQRSNKSWLKSKASCPLSVSS